MRVALVVVGVLAIAGCGAPSASKTQPVHDTLPDIAEPTEPAAESVPSDAPGVEAALAGFTEAEVDELGGVGCATEIAHILVAGDRYFAREGTYPLTLDDLSGDLDGQPALWTFDNVTQQVVPAPGSPCRDVFREQTRQMAYEACGIAQVTLEVATDAYIAVNGAAPVDQEQLVEDGLLAKQIENFRLAGGEVLVVAGSDCESLLEDESDRLVEEVATPASSPEECSVNRRTLEIAIEAYFAQFGMTPATETDLVDSGMLGGEFVDFDLAAGAKVVVAPGSDCI